MSERIPATFWATPSIQAIGPIIIYDGAFPNHPRDYYNLCAQSACLRYVYLLFAADETLLYVGRSHRPGNRFDRHRRLKMWWPEVSTLTLLRVEGVDRKDADATVDYLETYAIRKLSPVHNVSKVVAA